MPCTFIVQMKLSRIDLGTKVEHKFPGVDDAQTVLHTKGGGSFAYGTSTVELIKPTTLSQLDLI